ERLQLAHVDLEPQAVVLRHARGPAPARAVQDFVRVVVGIGVGGFGGPTRARQHLAGRCRRHAAIRLARAALAVALQPTGLQVLTTLTARAAAICLRLRAILDVVVAGVARARAVIADLAHAVSTDAAVLTGRARPALVATAIHIGFRAGLVAVSA